MSRPTITELVDHISQLSTVAGRLSGVVEAMELTDCVPDRVRDAIKNEACMVEAEVDVVMGWVTADDECS